MALLTWTDALTVGVKEIDEQHRRLVELANALHAAVLAGATSAALSQQLGELIRQAALHFATEERLFAETRYPEAEAHMREHEELVAQVNALKQRVDGGWLELDAEIAQYLCNWLTEHIVGADRQYGTHLNDAGVF